MFSNGRAALGLLALTEYKEIIPNSSHSKRQQHLCAGRPVPSVSHNSRPRELRARRLRPVSREGDVSSGSVLVEAKGLIGCNLTFW